MSQSMLKRKREQNEDTDHPNQHRPCDMCGIDVRKERQCDTFPPIICCQDCVPYEVDGQFIKLKPQPMGYGVEKYKVCDLDAKIPIHKWVKMCSSKRFISKESVLEYKCSCDVCSGKYAENTNQRIDFPGPCFTCKICKHLKRMDQFSKCNDKRGHSTKCRQCAGFGLPSLRSTPILLPPKGTVIPRDINQQMEDKMGNCLVLDLETTGIPTERSDHKNLEAYDNSRIVQIAWVIVNRDLDKQTPMRDYIVADQSYPIPNSQFHGVTEEIRKEAGIQFDIIHKQFRNDLAECNVTHIGSYNVEFDIGVWRSELYRRGLDDNAFYKNRKLVCFMRNAMSILGKKRFMSLESLHNSGSISLVSKKMVHSASQDIDYLLETLHSFLDKKTDAIFKASQNMTPSSKASNPSSDVPICIPDDTVLEFGKYKGRTFGCVLSYDQNYVRYAAKEMVISNLENARLFSEWAMGTCTTARED